MKQKIIAVEPLEGEEIKEIYYHLSALRELEYIVSVQNQELRETFSKDVKRTNEAYQNWWYKISKKYHLPVFEGKNWEFNFRTNTIYLL